MIRDLEKTIGNIIDKQSITFIGSSDESGVPEIKAMLAPRRREGLKTFYFTTNTSSRRVSHYLKNQKACIYFCDKRFFNGVMLQGVMEVLTDQDSKDMIWKEGDTMYYPLGKADPDYCVLKFTAKTGRFYRNFHSDDFEI